MYVYEEGRLVSSLAVTMSQKVYCDMLFPSNNIPDIGFTIVLPWTLIRNSRKVCQRSTSVDKRTNNVLFRYLVQQLKQISVPWNNFDKMNYKYNGIRYLCFDNTRRYLISSQMVINIAIWDKHHHMGNNGT